MRVTQEDIAREIIISQKMAMRFHIARTIGEYFYKKLPLDEQPIDFQEEIKVQFKALWKRVEDGENFNDVLKEWISRSEKFDIGQKSG